MKRVSAITLQADSPLGHQCIGSGHSLAAYDLVVITGPNGAGKTTIVNALCDVQKGVNVVDGQGNSAELTAKEIARSLLMRSGRDLMATFTSMEDALARASGIRRIREEGVLLDALLSSKRNAKYAFDRYKPDGESERPQAVDIAIKDYLQAEQAIASGALPPHALTLAAYNELGNSVARHLNREWIAVTSVDETKMRESESSVQPSHTVENGGPALDSAIAKAIDVFEFNVEELQKPVLDVEKNLKEAIDAARDFAPLAGDEQEPTVGEWPGRTRRLAEQTQCLATEKDERRKTIDQLNALRRDALSWLEAQGNAPNCPVCEQSIEEVQLKQQLAESPGGSAEETTRLEKEIDELQQRAEALNQAASRIEEVLRKVDGRLEGVNKQIDRWKKTALDFLEATMPAVDWAEGVKATGSKLKSSAEALTRDLDCLDTTLPASERLKQAASAVQKFRGSLSECKNTRKTAADRAQRAIEPATRQFNRLAPLRVLLLTRERLNETVWGPTWEQERLNESRRAVVNTWIKAARELREEKSNGERDVQDIVLADPGVKKRFKRLVDAAPHPFFSDATFAGDAVTSNSGEVHKKLSEGFSVIINLAAFIAVTGYACDDAEHQAGWIVLDEPTNGLDPQNRSAVAAYLGSLTANEMSRQMFVTTFEDKFRSELIDAAVASRRRVLEIKLNTWSGTSAATAPTLIPHEQKR